MIISRKICKALCFFAASFGFAQGLRPADGAFPFNVLEMDEKSFVSCRDLNREITNESPRVVISSDGHLSVAGERLRIFGTNLSEFPEKKLAELNARSLADRGYNCIRFHHTDADWTKCFVKYTSGKGEIDASGLDKFDYFVFQLKKYGIYTNLNLLTGRNYREKDGMPAGTDRISDWKNRHVLGFWNRKARELQKNYAKILLEHVNPYTGIALKDDPALAIVEINNEQGLIHSYLGHNMYDFPENLWNELEILWNQWLKNKGYDYDSLSEKNNLVVPAGKQLIAPETRWNLELHEGAKGTQSGEGDLKQINITGNGKQNWHIQFNKANLRIQRDMIYTVSFKAKASKNCDLSLGIMMAHDPWKNIGFNTQVSLEPEWKTYEFIVSGLEADSNARLNLGNMGFLSGTKIEFKNLEMHEGGNLVSVKKSENGILFPRAEDFGEFSESYKNLVLNFLYDVEMEYWTDMRDYIRKELSCEALLMGSAMGNTSTGLSMLFDIVDSHAYFNHPVFPGKDWDQNNYYVKNDDLTCQDCSKTLTSLAGYRVFGKPFSVSEYDHPYPNQFSAEMYPMYAAFASYQDWDCIYTFCSDVISPSQVQNNKITGYFDQTHNPVKAAAAPLASRIFRTGAIKPEETYVWINLSEEKERANLQRFGSWSVGNTAVWGFDPVMAMGAQTGILWGTTPDEKWKGSEVEKARELTAAMKGSLKTGGKGLSGNSGSSSVFWEEAKGTFRALGKDAFVYVGRKDSPVLKEASEKDFNNFEFIPDGDFASVMGVRRPDGKWIFFAGSWSGNKGELLREYSRSSPYSTSKEVIQREKLNLSSKPPYSTRDALTLSASGTLKSLKENMKFRPLSNKGLPEGKAQKSATFRLSETSGTLWYLLEP